MLVIVWASLRLGLRGGSTVAAMATLTTLLVASLQPALTLEVLNPLRANLLAQCSTALLIGASADWIRRSETRYRQVVGLIPVLLYSGRFLRMPRQGTRPEVEIVFASPAAKPILNCEPEALVGDFPAWLEHIKPADRELLWAAVAQLVLQKQPVTCEYRLANENDAAEFKPDPESSPASNPMVNLARQLASMSDRYVRETLTPHFGLDGQLDGWEGVVVDITEQRQLGHDLPARPICCAAPDRPFAHGHLFCSRRTGQTAAGQRSAPGNCWASAGAFGRRQPFAGFLPLA